MGRLCRAGYIAPLKRSGGEAQVAHHEVVGLALLRIAGRDGLAGLHPGDAVPKGAAVRPAGVLADVDFRLAIRHSVLPFLSPGPSRVRRHERLSVGLPTESSHTDTPHPSPKLSVCPLSLRQLPQP